MANNNKDNDKSNIVPIRGNVPLGFMADSINVGGQVSSADYSKKMQKLQNEMLSESYEMMRKHNNPPEEIAEKLVESESYQSFEKAWRKLTQSVEKLEMAAGKGR
ncbi:MAG: hypothetical protein K0R98_2027 [Rickettsiaceae bacterium]|nr:hypothetical protein [Rickettsiaceae bacterium]